MESQSPREANSRTRSPLVASGQRGPHRDLLTVLERHRRGTYARPIAAHTRAAFAWVQETIGPQRRPLLLDAGCGVAEATRELARRHPECWIVGVDRSAHRLGKAGWTEPGLRSGNLVLARAELVDFWRLARAAGWRLERHFLLYPNPWPKPGHLVRRWHAHPVFETVLALGGRLELRTNWRVYAEEFALAVEFFGHGPASLERFEPRAEVTPFERKFAASRHRLYRVTVDLGRTQASREARGDDHAG